MSKLVRYEFLGNGAIFWVLCISIIGIPLAILYLLDSTVRIDNEMEDPEKFLAEYRQNK